MTKRKIKTRRVRFSGYSDRRDSGRLIDYLPSLPQLTSEILAVLGATIIASLIISKVPALSKLVRDNTPAGPLNP